MAKKIPKDLSRSVLLIDYNGCDIGDKLDNYLKVANALTFRVFSK